MVDDVESTDLESEEGDADIWAMTHRLELELNSLEEVANQIHERAQRRRLGYRQGFVPRAFEGTQSYDSDTDLMMSVIADRVAYTRKRIKEVRKRLLQRARRGRTSRIWEVVWRLRGYFMGAKTGRWHLSFRDLLMGFAFLFRKFFARRGRAEEPKVEEKEKSEEEQEEEFD